MTQDEIIEMAKEAGMTPMKLFGATKFIEVWTPDLLAFAKLVAAKASAQRTWVGLTDEDWKEIEDMPDTFDQGVAWAQAKLKEKNT